MSVTTIDLAAGRPLVNALALWLWASRAEGQSSPRRQSRLAELKLTNALQQQQGAVQTAVQRTGLKDSSPPIYPP
jgi:hypothetical protein